MGTLLHGLTSLSPLQQDELGGPEVADAPCPLSPLLKAQRFPGWCQLHGHPCPQPNWPWTPCTQEGGDDTRVAPK